MKKGVDVAVIGGGPSGSLAAFTAAKLGAEVSVCEEHKEIGLPIHCPGHISVRGLRLLGLNLPQDIIENEIRGARFYSASGKEFGTRVSSPVTVVLNRALFDQYLSKIAAKVGVQYLLQSRAESILTISGYAKGIHMKRKEGRKILKSKVVIDAEGCSSLLLKRFGLRTLNRNMLVRGIYAEVDSVEDIIKDEVEVYFGRKYAPGFFAWIIPRRDSSAKIGLATCTGNPREYLDRFMSKHPVASIKLRKSKVMKMAVHPISLGGPVPKTYSNGLLAVGDAASHVKSTTGGGLVFGLMCSKLAGEVAYKCLIKNDFSERALSQYQIKWKKQIGFDLQAARWLRVLLNRISDEKMNRLIDLSHKFELNKALEGAGDLDFEGKSMIQMTRYPSTWILILFSLLHP